jgi:hypothetical protein
VKESESLWHFLLVMQVLRFIKLLSLIMTNQLRTAVLGSIKRYTDFWKQYNFSDWEESTRAGDHFALEMKRVNTVEG